MTAAITDFHECWTPLQNVESVDGTHAEFVDATGIPLFIGQDDGRE